MHIKANVFTMSERVADNDETRLVGTPLVYFDYQSLGFQKNAKVATSSQVQHTKNDHHTHTSTNPRHLSHKCISLDCRVPAEIEPSDLSAVLFRNFERC